MLLLQHSAQCFALITTFPLPSLITCFPSLADRRHAPMSLRPLSCFEEGKVLTYQNPKPTGSFQPSMLWHMPGPVQAYIHDTRLGEAACAHRCTHLRAAVLLGEQDRRLQTVVEGFQAAQHISRHLSWFWLGQS